MPMSKGFTPSYREPKFTNEDTQMAITAYLASGGKVHKCRDARHSKDCVLGRR